MQLTGNSQIRHVIWAQFGATIAVAIVLLYIDVWYAWSGLIGGMISASVYTLTAHKIFVPYRAQNPVEVLARMFGAEIQKLLLTGAFFAVAIFTIHSLSVGALLGTYLFIQVLVPMIVLFSVDRLKTRY